MERTEQILHEAIEHFGDRKQLVKSLEELGELTQAIAKYFDDPSEKNRENIKEEMADVSITLSQVMIITGITTHQVAKVKADKLDRLELYIQNFKK